jgi:PHD/YefM family antitoxin component YafN of YafNO toxin-antitoxin module
MTTTIAITKARKNLGAIVKKINLEKGYIILEKNSLPIAGIMDIDEFEDYLDAQNVLIAKEITSSRKDAGAKRICSTRVLLDL